MIALYKGTSMISRLIRWRTGTLTPAKYSHASWINQVEEDEYEAWPGGVQHLDHFGFNHTPGTVIDLFDVDLTQGELDGLIEFLDSQIGKAYDYRAIAGFIVRLPVQDKKHLFCSEYIFAGFLHIKKPLLERVQAWEVPPTYLPLSPLLKSAGSTLVSQPTANRPQSTHHSQQPTLHTPQVPLSEVLS